MMDIQAMNQVSISVLEQIRQAFADYRRAEGCSCCRDNDAHEEAEKRLAERLSGQGYNVTISHEHPFKIILI